MQASTYCGTVELSCRSCTVFMSTCCSVLLRALDFRSPPFQKNFSFSDLTCYNALVLLLLLKNYAVSSCMLSANHNHCLNNVTFRYTEKKNNKSYFYN